MSETDRVFAGSIPENYDRYLVPLIFESFAQDIARRAHGCGLETALGDASPHAFQRQPHAVIGRDHVWRQALTQHLVVQIGMHVGNDGAARLEALDP